MVLRYSHVCLQCLYKRTSTGHRYQIGEVFMHMSEEETQEALEKAKERLQEELTKLKTSAETTEGVMTQLKVQLYSKFGDSINLEAD